MLSVIENPALWWVVAGAAAGLGLLGACLALGTCIEKNHEVGLAWRAWMTGALFVLLLWLLSGCSPAAADSAGLGGCAMGNEESEKATQKETEMKRNKREGIEERSRDDCAWWGKLPRGIPAKEKPEAQINDTSGRLALAIKDRLWLLSQVAK